MNKDNAKDFLPLVQALSERKVIQLYYDNTWHDHENIKFDSSPDKYRIKPTPRLRPWKPEEVPVGKLIRSKTMAPTLILCAKTEYGNIKCPALFFFGGFYAWQNEPSLSHMFLGDLVTSNSKHEHSLDHGKTWLPCGVMENEG